MKTRALIEAGAPLGPAETPVITTERLLLRAPRREDFPAYAEMWSETAVGAQADAKPLSREAAWTKFARSVGFWILNGYGPFMVEDRENGTFFGIAGFSEYERDVTPSLRGKPEFGWALAPAARGRGVATEAVRACLDWGDQTLPAATFSCLIDDGNTASVRVAEKCGFVEYARGVYQGGPVLLFARPPGRPYGDARPAPVTVRNKRS